MKNNRKAEGIFFIGESAKRIKEITEEDIELFAQGTGDFNPLHKDAEFAENSRFEERITHGLFGAGLNSALLGNQLPGNGSIYLSQTLRFILPVSIGDTLTAEVYVTGWNEEKMIIHLDTFCINQDNSKEITGKQYCLSRMYFDRTFRIENQSWERIRKISSSEVLVGMSLFSLSQR
jgi:acyl dehydratase